MAECIYKEKKKLVCVQLASWNNSYSCGLPSVTSLYEGVEQILL